MTIARAGFLVVAVVAALAPSAAAQPRAQKKPAGPLPVVVAVGPVAHDARRAEHPPVAAAVEAALRGAVQGAAPSGGSAKLLGPDDEARIARGLARRWVVLADLPPTDRCRALAADVCFAARVVEEAGASVVEVDALDGTKRSVVATTRFAVGGDGDRARVDEAARRFVAEVLRPASTKTDGTADPAAGAAPPAAPSP